MTLVNPPYLLSSPSGGTAAGLALGVHLSSLTAKVHAFGVCDSPDYFYEYIQGLLDGMVPPGSPQAVNSRDITQVTDVSISSSIYDPFFVVIPMHISFKFSLHHRSSIEGTDVGSLHV